MERLSEVAGEAQQSRGYSNEPEPDSSTRFYVPLPPTKPLFHSMAAAVFQATKGARKNRVILHPKAGCGWPPDGGESASDQGCTAHSHGQAGTLAGGGSQGSRALGATGDAGRKCRFLGFGEQWNVKPG